MNRIELASRTEQLLAEAGLHGASIETWLKLAIINLVLTYADDHKARVKPVRTMSARAFRLEFGELDDTVVVVKRTPDGIVAQGTWVPAAGQTLERTASALGLCCSPRRRRRRVGVTA